MGVLCLFCRFRGLFFNHNQEKAAGRAAGAAGRPQKHCHCGLWELRLRLPDGRRERNPGNETAVGGTWVPSGGNGAAG